MILVLRENKIRALIFEPNVVTPYILGWRDYYIFALLDVARVFNFGIAKLSATIEIAEFHEKFWRNFFKALAHEACFFSKKM